MAAFRAKNGQNVRNLFGERINYKVNAFPNDSRNLPLPPIKDFSFAETRLYGRINKSHEAIVVSPRRLKDIPSAQGKVRAVNFVVDAFEAMKLDFDKAAFGQKISPSDPYLATLTATHGFVDPETQYATYMGTVTEYFLNNFLTKTQRAAIVSFDTFVPVFMEFVHEITQVKPITKTGFVTSTFCDSRVSGLSVQVASLDAGDDEVKGDFINSPNFSFFKSVALNRGFSIDKNMPWKLTADISSPPMLKFAARYGMTNENMILGNFYIPAYLDDIINLKKLAVRCYNGFVANTPRNLDAGRVCMKTISLQEFVISYPTAFWVDKYVDIRYNEQKKPISQGALKVLYKKARDLRETAGSAAVIQMVNEIIRGFANFEGSFSKQFLRQKNIQTGQKFKPTY